MDADPFPLHVWVCRTASVTRTLTGLLHATIFIAQEKRARKLRQTFSFTLPRFLLLYVYQKEGVVGISYIPPVIIV